MFKLSGSSPAPGTKSYDNCLGLQFSESTGLTTAMIQTKSIEFRQQNPGKNSDFTLIVFNAAGTVINSLTVTFGNGSSNLLGFSNNFFQLNDYQYFVAGMSNGYATKN